MPNILVADDDPNVALLVKMTLAKDPDYNIEIVSNGEDALRKVAGDPPDLLLLDVMMPGVDGMEVCRRIKTDDKTKYIPVIMVTAKRESEDMIRGMELGANDYITKPFNPEELLARVRVHLRIKSLESELKAKSELEAVLKMSITLQHEINNPLTGVLGNAELLQDRSGMSEKDIDESVNAIYASTMRIKDIVRQMGKVSRLISTKYVGDNEMIDILKSSDEDGASGDKKRDIAS